MAVEKVVLGGGCFWCVESVFSDIIGIYSVTSGYAGGHDGNPTYERICTGTTGHAEVVEIEYDSSIIDLTELLKIFFTIHDPTTLNQQGNDVGTQYRSVIFYKNDHELQIAEALIAELKAQKIFQSEIVTSMEKLEIFFPAEEYHQNYFKKNPSNLYCQYSIPPKRKKIIEQFSKYLK